MTAQAPQRPAGSRGSDPSERRPGVFRALFVTVSLVLATLAGIITALILETAFGLPFAPTWVVASLVLFVVPAVIVYRRAQRRAP